MKFQILNNEQIGFYNEVGNLSSIIKPSGSNLVIHPISPSGDIELGQNGTVNDVELGNLATPVNMTFLGGGTITPNGNTLYIGDSSAGDSVILSNVTIGSSVIWSTGLSGSFSGSHYGSFFGDGRGLVGITATVEPAGPIGSIQFNNDINNSGSGDFIFNKTTGAVTITGSVNVSGSTTADFFFGNGAGLTGITSTFAPTGQDKSIQFNKGGTEISGSDGILFDYDNNNLNVKGYISASLLTGSATLTGSFTGDLNGDGTNITNVVGNTTFTGNPEVVGNPEIVGTLQITGSIGIKDPITSSQYISVTHNTNYADGATEIHINGVRGSDFWSGGGTIHLTRDASSPHPDTGGLRLSAYGDASSGSPRYSHIHAGGGGVSSTITIGSSIQPITNGYTFGTSGRRWGYSYFQSVDISSINNVSPLKIKGGSINVNDKTVEVTNNSGTVEEYTSSLFEIRNNGDFWVVPRGYNASYQTANMYISASGEYVSWGNGTYNLATLEGTSYNGTLRVGNSNGTIYGGSGGTLKLNDRSLVHGCVSLGVSPWDGVLISQGSGTNPIRFESDKILFGRIYYNEEVTLDITNSRLLLNAPGNTDFTSPTHNLHVRRNNDFLLFENESQVKKAEIDQNGNLFISGSEIDFTNLPTTDPGVAGRLFQTGSEAIGATAGFQLVLISQG